MYRRSVVFRIAFEALHCWPDASNYLRHPHRHLFHVEGELVVTGDNREVEFIELGRQVKNHISVKFHTSEDALVDLGSTSCEQLAEMIAEQFSLFRCSVFEDSENGAIVERLI